MLVKSKSYKSSLFRHKSHPKNSQFTELIGLFSIRENNGLSQYPALEILSKVTPKKFYTHELSIPFNGGGLQDGGCCPFERDIRPGGFRVDLGTGEYKCYRCGNTGNNILVFTRSLYGLKIDDALYKLQRDWGLL